MTKKYIPINIMKCLPNIFPTCHIEYVWHVLGNGRGCLHSATLGLVIWHSKHTNNKSHPTLYGADSSPLDTEHDFSSTDKHIS
jgi:hypothetical protein